ncbi:EAL domain-containing protein [Desulfurobacterium atlanticum]|uniref:Diguanylate cyclase (GGDEF) domain-containing protein n=1 Tax=Desulfurobacterium atlanticum TaxID=240169 RepID=A0A238YW16_9BACT|nr:GGDEF domain-containing protein [Desulfurobacterium atlanticum]SNR74921.1 diguanylate cyclase (GGDEF) domain-containing protein [Desulfurobacterium atlanticum]
MRLKEILLNLNITEDKLNNLQSLKKYIKPEDKEKIINTLLEKIKLLYHKGTNHYYSKSYTDTFKKLLSEFIDSILTGNIKLIELQIKNITNIHHNRKTEKFLEGYLQLIKLILDEIHPPKKEEENFKLFVMILIIILFNFVIEKFKYENSQEIDNITKLHSKSLFFNKFHEIIEKTNTIALIDIKEFKNINIFYGFQTGNTVLSIFSNLLQSYFPNAFITRIQNDEFLLLSEKDCNTVYLNLRNLQNELTKHPPAIPIGKTSENILLTFSASVIDESFCPTGDPDYLLWVLYEGMKKAKKNKNGISILYPKEITKSILDRKLMLDVIDSLKNENIKAGLHGIYHVKDSNKILFKEALARIKVKDTIIDAEKFIKVISKTDIEEKLDRLMVKKILEYIKEKRPDFKISINLSSNFMQDSFSWFLDTLKFFNIDETQIVVELTERDDITEIPRIKDKLSILKRRGISIFIDDFGIKYANYELLRALPVSGIKLEGSIVKNIGNSTLDKHFITYTIKLAKEKKLTLVAEFVENEGIKKTLEKIAEEENFENLYCQGFLFEKVNLI